jgi:TonB-linked SusC/RagA family outer membrane protein
MKLVLVLMIATSLQAAAGPSDAQKVTISGENIPLKKIFREIRKQTDFQFFYKNEYLKKAKPVDIHVKNVPLKEALDDCFKDQPLSYGLVGDIIVVKKKEKTIYNTMSASEVAIDFSQITGIVSDSATGNLLNGVSIQIKGSVVGTITDAKGRFSLSVPDNAVLEVSYLGYKSKEIRVNGKSELRVFLSATTTGLNQVVVVGYGTQKKVNVTGAISTIDSKEIEGRSVNSTVEVLQGLAPNLNVSVTSDGGAADASMSLNIRGVGSLSSSQPYVLIDGVRATQEELADLNPNDIESISILKDAASAAIYGAQAAYGVILVNTKSGQENQKFTINYSNSIRFKRRIYVPPTVSSVTFAKIANEANENYDGQTMFSDEQITMMQNFIDGKLGKYGTAPDPDHPNQWLGIGDGSSNGWYSGFANTNWWDIMFKKTEVTQQHDISLRGGSKNVTYYLSGGYFNDPGQLRYGSNEEYYRRYNLYSNVSATITKWLKISNITRITQVNNSFPATLEGGTRSRLYHDIMRFSPNTPWRTPPVKDAQGNVIVPSQLAFNAGFNENNGSNKYDIDKLVSTLRAEISVNKDLTVKGDFTFKRRFYNKTLNFKKWILMGPLGTPSLTFQANNNQITKYWQKLRYGSFNIYANYKKTLLKVHHFNLLVGYQQEEYNNEQLTVGRKDVIDDELSSVNAAVGDLVGPDNPIDEWATLGAFGRLTYNYKNKYLFEFNGRYDGSSKFAKDNRFGLFPSISLGYNIDKEKFWSPLRNIINRLKIRASWGKLGNQEVTGYLYLPTISVTTQLPWIIGNERPVYTNPPQITSPDITWETAVTKNLGADLGFLNNRLSASFDAYIRRTYNMFGPVSALPTVLGTAPPETNSATLKTKGWELVVGWRDHVQPFDYNVKFMLSNNNTFITKYNNPDKVLSNYYVGEELGEIWGFEAAQLFQSEGEVQKYTSQVNLSYLGTNWQPGDVKYKDLNRDGKVDVGDNTVSNPGDQRIIGNSHPQYRISLQGGISWKNFSLNMLWSGIGKRDIMLDTYASLFWGFNGQPHTHLTNYVIDRAWSKSNPNGYLPIQLSSGGRAGFGKDRQPSSRYIQNGAYIRLQNLNIGYAFSPSITQKLHLKELRIYFSGENLLTLTKMWPNFDPGLAATGSISRTSDGRDYPLAQVYSIGINVSL